MGKKNEEWLKIYLKHVYTVSLETHVNKEEGYKFKAVDTFQRNFDIEAKDLPSMIEASIVNNNLVAGSWYFPRKMLLIFATENPKETRDILRQLFNENEPVSKRIDITKKSFDDLMNIRNKRLNGNAHSFIGIRFLSLLLGYRYPELYNALKPREWNIFSKFINEDFMISTGTSDGERYEAYLPNIEEMRTFIKGNTEVEKIKDALTKDLAFNDSEYRWMTQDVIYVVSQLIQKENISGIDVNNIEPETASAEGDNNSGEKENLTTGDRFTYEEDLQNFVYENLDKISIDKKLELFYDSDGKSGQYYPIKGVGEIDMLTVDNDGNFVVIELKRNLAADAVVAQLARYMQWVEENIANKIGKNVSGIIISHGAKKSILHSTRALRFPVSIKLYKLKLELESMS